MHFAVAGSTVESAGLDWFLPWVCALYCFCKPGIYRIILGGDVLLFCLLWDLHFIVVQAFVYVRCVLFWVLLWALALWRF